MSALLRGSAEWAVVLRSHSHSTGEVLDELPRAGRKLGLQMHALILRNGISSHGLHPDALARLQVAVDPGGSKARATAPVRAGLHAPIPFNPVYVDHPPNPTPVGIPAYPATW